MSLLKRIACTALVVAMSNFLPAEAKDKTAFLPKEITRSAIQEGSPQAVRAGYTKTYLALLTEALLNGLKDKNTVTTNDIAIASIIYKKFLDYALSGTDPTFEDADYTKMLAFEKKFSLPPIFMSKSDAKTAK